jgi:hypothetical protein
MKTPPTHILYQNGDPQAPEQIKDRNGEIVLRLCKLCGRAEIELSEPCFLRFQPEVDFASPEETSTLPSQDGAST